MRSYDTGDARLLAHLAAFERLTAEEGGRAQARLEERLGAERARFLVKALSPRAPTRPYPADLPSAASA